jgi:hypothetical protein
MHGGLHRPRRLEEYGTAAEAFLHVAVPRSGQLRRQPGMGRYFRLVGLYPRRARVCARRGDEIPPNIIAE